MEKKKKKKDGFPLSGDKCACGCDGLHALWLTSPGWGALVIFESLLKAKDSHQPTVRHFTLNHLSSECDGFLFGIGGVKVKL